MGRVMPSQGSAIFKIWTSRGSKKAFVESLVLLTVLNQLWKYVVFVTLHSSLPRFIKNNVYKKKNGI